MANHALPTVTSNYTDFVTQLRERIDDVAKGLDVAATNIPEGSIRWDSSSNNWKKYVSGNWNTQLTAAYSININGTVGATTPATGAFTTLSTSGVASLGASSTVGNVAIVGVSGAQTLTNKTLTAPVISTITNTGTITLPTSTTTLVGTDTTDTLTNKTLTTPKFENGGAIHAISGLSSEAVLTFGATQGSGSNIKITNGALGVAPIISAVGTFNNINLNLVGKGTGTVTINGVTAVDISTAQTLTNKTIGTGSSYAGSTITVANGGTGATTFTAGALLKGAGTNAISVATAAEIVAAIGTTSVANATNASSAGSAGSAGSATNIAGGATGQIPYQSAAGTTGFIASGSAGTVLSSAGNGNYGWITQTSANTANTIVTRDSSGNFAAGTITATTQTAGDNSTKVATTAFVQTAISNAVPPVNIQTFNSTAAWTKPTGGQTMARIQVWGAGGGGGSIPNNYGSTGAGGGYMELTVPLSYLAATVTATVGAGGTALTSASSFTGNAGGFSSFPLSTAVNGLTVVKATGGGTSTASVPETPYYLQNGGAPVNSNGTENRVDESWLGGTGWTTATADYAARAGATAFYGGAAGSNPGYYATTVDGARSLFGGHGGGITVISNGGGYNFTAAVQPGGGGSSGSSPWAWGSSQAGADGRVVVTCW
jgi:hypothetical protein